MCVEDCLSPLLRTDDTGWRSRKWTGHSFYEWKTSDCRGTLLSED